MSGGELAEGLAWMLHRMITDDGARRRVRARFELALEATRRPELRAAYDEMGRASAPRPRSCWPSAVRPSRSGTPGR